MTDHPPVSVAHVSDLHPTGVLRFGLDLFLGKRALGWASLVLRRNRRHPFAQLRRTLLDIRHHPPDLLLVGGDMVNLGLPEEFAASRGVLAESGLPPERISAVPGNHDRYTRDAWRRRLFETYFGAFAGSDLPFPDDLFPFLQVRPGLAVVGVCSGWPASAIQARGTVGRDQLRRLEVLLSHPAVRRGPAVILIHHPPVPYEDPLHQWLNGLHDWRALIDLAAGTGAVLLHGHRHLSLHTLVQTPRGEVRVLGVPSASDRGGSSPRAGGYHRYRFDPAGFLDGERRLWNERLARFDVEPLPDPRRVRVEDLG